MPYFKMEGYGRDTGRHRTRTFQAKDIDDAISQASANGTIVDAATVQRIFPIEHFFSKVVGISYNNPDGTDRQMIVRHCTIPEMLALHHEPNNTYSRHAIAVVRHSGEQVGYLPDDTAEEVLSLMRGSTTVVCYACEHTGGDTVHGKPTLGLNVLILKVADPETDMEIVDAYVRQAIDNE
jgi:HIRAN domain